MNCLVKISARILTTVGALALLGLCSVPAHAADVSGYSLRKGRYFIQTNATDLELDSNFAFSMLASIDVTETGSVTNANFHFADETFNPMDNLGDSWTFLDSFPTLDELNASYPPGKYAMEFQAAADGNFLCDLNLPDAPFPPTIKLTDFAELQRVDPSRPLRLAWEYSEPPSSNDFVQVYIQLGHATVDQTPDFGEPGALNGTVRSITLLPGALLPGVIYGLNLEITRTVSTNAACHPSASGVVGTLSSTEIIFQTLVPPAVRLLSAPVNDVASVEVLTAPGGQVVLQGSGDLVAWSNLGTNAASSGTNVFNVQLDGRMRAFFRASQP